MRVRGLHLLLTSRILAPSATRRFPRTFEDFQDLLTDLSLQPLSFLCPFYCLGAREGPGLIGLPYFFTPRGSPQLPPVPRFLYGV